MTKGSALSNPKEWGKLNDAFKPLAVTADIKHFKTKKERKLVAQNAEAAALVFI
jgi:hypothetical protein